MQSIEEVHFNNGTYINKYGEFIDPEESDHDEDEDEYEISNTQYDTVIMQPHIANMPNYVMPQMAYQDYHPFQTDTVDPNEYDLDEIEELLEISTECSGQGFPCKHQISVRKTDGTIETSIQSTKHIWELFKKFDYPLHLLPTSMSKLQEFLLHFSMCGPSFELQQKIMDKSIQDGYKISVINEGQKYMDYLQIGPQITFCKRVIRKPTMNYTVFKQFQSLESSTSKQVFILPITSELDLHWFSGIEIIGNDHKKVPHNQINMVKLVLSEPNGDYTPICAWYGKLLTKNEKFNFIQNIPIKKTDKNQSISVIIDSNVHIMDVYAYLHNEEYSKSKIRHEIYHMNSYHKLYTGPLKKEINMSCDGLYYQLRLCLVSKKSGYKHLFPADVIKSFSLKYGDDEIYKEVPFVLIKYESIGKLEYGLCTPSVGQIVGRVFTGDLKLTLNFIDGVNWTDYNITVCGLLQEMIEIAIPYSAHDNIMHQMLI